ncbi:MAG: hypothetical protein JWL87_190 [Candidatus Adlerbacteria bacterium]|nr:hypothetical protein [Candidatus Adlerbacteria bacterium]
MRRRLLAFAPFLLVFSVFLFIANMVVYEAWAAMFMLNGWVPALTLGLVLGLLSGTFVLSTFLGTRYHTVWTRAYYKASAVWMGAFAYLFIAASVYGVAVFVAGSLVPWVGWASMALALLVSAYGYAHARTIVVRELEAQLPNLPPAWEGRRLAFISDVHLGQIHGEKSMQRVVDAVNSTAHDLVCIGGDLFDGTTAPDLKRLAAPLASLKAPMGIYFITGNHEEYGDAAAFMDALRSADVRVLQDELLDIDGVQLIGVDYKTTGGRDEFAAVLAALPIAPEKPSILLKHEPRHLEVASGAGISLQLSGHTHLGQQWPFMHLAQLTYQGFAYGLKRLGSMQVYTSSGVGTWGPPLRVGTNSEVVVLTFTK